MTTVKDLPRDLQNIVFDYKYGKYQDQKKIVIKQLKATFSKKYPNILYNINFPKIFIKSAIKKIYQIEKTLINDYQINRPKHIRHLHKCKTYVRIAERRFRKSPTYSAYYPTNEYFDYIMFQKSAMEYFEFFIMLEHDSFDISCTESSRRLARTIIFPGGRILI